MVEARRADDETEDEVDVAVAEQPASVFPLLLPPMLAGRPSSLTQMLEQSGTLTPEQIVRAQQIAHESTTILANAIVREGLVMGSDLAAMTALHMGVPLVDLRSESIQPQAVALLPEHLASRYLALPIKLQGNRLTVALTPSSPSICERRISRSCRTSYVVRSIASIVNRLSRYTRMVSTTRV